MIIQELKEIVNTCSNSVQWQIQMESNHHYMKQKAKQFADC